MKKAIKCVKAPSAIGPYSQGIITENFIFLSGQIPLLPNGEIAGSEIEEQTKQVLTNIEAVLNEAGLTKENIVKTTIFLQDMNDFAKVNVVYGNFFEGTTFPARSTVEVSRLPKDVKIEIEAVAVK